MPKSARLVPVKKLVAPPGVNPHLRTYYVNPDKDKPGDKKDEATEVKDITSFLGRAADKLEKLSKENYRSYGFDKAKTKEELKDLVTNAIETEAKRQYYKPTDVFKGTYLLAAGVLAGVDAKTLKKLTTRFKTSFYERGLEAFGIYPEDTTTSHGPTKMWYNLLGSYATLRRMGFNRKQALEVHGRLTLSHVAPDGVDVAGFNKAATNGEVARGILINHLAYSRAHRKLGVPIIADLMAGHMEGLSLNNGTPFQKALGHLYTTTQLILKKLAPKLKKKTFYRGMVVPAFEGKFKVKSGRTQSVSDQFEVGMFFAGVMAEDVAEKGFRPAHELVELPRGYTDTFEQIEVFYDKPREGMLLRLRGLKDTRRIIFSMTEETIPVYDKVYNLTKAAKNMAEEETETLFFA